MIVIGAGFPKTGTKSFWHAMEILGYNHLGVLQISSFKLNTFVLRLLI